MSGKKRLKIKINQIIVLMLLLEIIMSFVLFDISSSVFSYAFGEISSDNATNNANVLFSCRLEKEKQYINDENMKLLIDIEVRNEGFFSGEIILNDSNFVFKDDVKEGITSITEDKIVLSQINATSKVSFEIKIQPKKPDDFRLEFLNKESDVKLTGTYVTDKDSKIDINATRSVNLILENPYKDTEEDYMDLYADIITNDIFKINGMNKRIIQIYVKSGIKDNVYPIEKTKINMTVPEEVEEIEVLSRGTYATNGKSASEFTKNEWEYTAQSNSLEINLENIEENGIVSWVKDKKDEFIINLTFDENVDLSDKNVELSNKINLYDRVSELKKSIVIDNFFENKSNIVEYQVQSLQSDIAKGKLYSKEETEFKTLQQIDIRYKGISEKIIINEGLSNYILQDDRQDVKTSGGYKSSKIHKEELENILGEKGSLVIKNSQNEIISTINKNTVTDENGYIVINYENIENIIVEIQDPENTGVICIENTMFVKEENDNDILKEARALLISGTLTSLDNIDERNMNKEIALKESATKAELTINTPKLSVKDVNENIELRLRLYTNSEEYNLYKNPYFEIELPKEIDIIEVNKIDILYEEELKVDYVRMAIREDGQKVLQLKLMGEQTRHTESDITKGTNIVINSSINVKRNTTAKSGDIVLKYENEYDNSNKILNMQVEYILPVELEKSTSLNALNLETVQESGLTDSVIVSKEISAGDGNDIYERQVQKITLIIKNNTTEKIENLVVKDPIPDEMIYATETASLAYENTWNEHEEIKEYTQNIEVIEPEDEVKLEYWVIPKKASENVGKTIGTKATVTLGEGIYESNLIQNTIKEAKLQIELTTRENNSSSHFYSGKDISYIIKVKNLTDTDMSNVVVQDYVPKEMKYETSSYLQKDAKGEYYEIPSSAIINENYDSDKGLITWNIDTLKANEEKAVKAVLWTQEIESDDETILIENQASATVDNLEYKSNKMWIRQFNKVKLDVKLTSSLQDTYLYEQDEFEYIVTVKNTSKEYGVSYEMKDKLPEGLSLKEVSYYYNGEELKISGKEDISLELCIEANKTETIKIKVVADELEDNVKQLEIRNKVSLTSEFIEDVDSNELVNIIKEKVTEPTDPTDPTDPVQPTDPTNPTDPTDPTNPTEPEETENYQISGVAWLDENKNGARETSEQLISGVEVRLMYGEDATYVKDSSGNIYKEITDEDGKYSFKNLKPGKYMLIFVFDNNSYSITQYKQSGVNEALNSDAILDKIKDEDKYISVGLTDNITITTKDIENIDIGLVENKILDLKLNKYVSQIEIQENKNTIVHQYNKSSLAKIELNSKTADNTNLIIEYKIEIVNEGETGAYVQKVVDYLPEGLSFNASENEGWTQENGYLTNTSLENAIINSGETRTLTLVLNKKMTRNNFGTITNVAEIQEIYNENGLEDVDSIPGNKDEKEDDLSSADIIIGVKTGKIIIYISLTIVMFAIMSVGIYFIKKKVLEL